MNLSDRIGPGTYYGKQRTLPWWDGEMIQWRGYLLCYEPLGPQERSGPTYVYLPGGERWTWRLMRENGAKPPAAWRMADS